MMQEGLRVFNANLHPLLSVRVLRDKLSAPFCGVNVPRGHLIRTGTVSCMNDLIISIV